MLTYDLGTISLLVCPSVAVRDTPATDRQRSHRTPERGKASCRVRASRFQTIRGTEYNADLVATFSAMLRHVQTLAHFCQFSRGLDGRCAISGSAPAPVIGHQGLHHVFTLGSDRSSHCQRTVSMRHDVSREMTGPECRRGVRRRVPAPCLPAQTNLASLGRRWLGRSPRQLVLPCTSSTSATPYPLSGEGPLPRTCSSCSDPLTGDAAAFQSQPYQPFLPSHPTPSHAPTVRSLLRLLSCPIA